MRRIPEAVFHAQPISSFFGLSEFNVGREKERERKN